MNNDTAYQPRVLLTCPVSKHKDYILFAWIKYIKTLTYKNYDILLVDNSDEPFTSMKIQAERINCIHVDKGHLKIREVMAICNNISKTWALQNGYDYIFHLECDIFPPRDVIQRLLAHQLPVVSGLYMISRFQDMQPMIQVYEYHGELNESHAWDLTEGFLKTTGGLVQVANAGLGCTLIHKTVLEKLNFHVNMEEEGHADSFMGRDLYNMRVPVYVDTSIFCKHYNSSWSKLKNK